MATGRNGESLASRAVIVEFDRAPIPPGMHALHRCDNPPCVNRGHLYLGTPKQNTADMLSRGRGVAPTNEGNGRSTIPDAIVEAMRRRHDGGESYKSIARAYHVHPVTVSRICRGLRRPST